MNPLLALGVAGAALVVLYTALAVRYRRRARRLIEEWQRYELAQEDGPDGVVAFHVDGELVDLDAARPDWMRPDLIDAGD